MKWNGLAATLLAAGCIVSGHALADPPGALQIDAAHDGHIHFKKDFHAPLKQRWSRDLGGTTSYPVYGGGLVYVSAYAQSGTEVYALHPKDGTTAWHVTVQGGGSPMYDNGHVFIPGSGGFLQAFDASTGTVQWGSQQQGEFFFDDPGTASNGHVYFTGNESGVVLYAVNESDGSLDWTQGGPAGDSVPAVAAHKVIVTYPCDDSAYKASNGSFEWAFTQGCDGGGGGVPVVFENRVYVDDGIDEVVLDATTGQEVRPFVSEEFLPAFWRPSSGDSMGFVVGNNGALTAFDAATGTTAWSVTGKSYSVAPVIVNDTLFIGDFSGTLYALDPATGNQIWSTNLGTEIGFGSRNGSGLGAGGGVLFVPSGNTISGWVPKRRGG